MTRQLKRDAFTTKVFHYLVDHPASTFATTATGMGVSDPQDCSAALNHLYRQGHLERQKLPKSNGTYAYFVPDRERNTAQPCQCADEENASDIAALEIQMAVVSAQIEVLQAWKRDAIARFPDLDVDPLVLKAREIVAKHFAQRGMPLRAQEAREGLGDSLPAMELAVAALRAAEEA